MDNYDDRGLYEQSCSQIDESHQNQPNDRQNEVVDINVHFNVTDKNRVIQDKNKDGDHRHLYSIAEENLQANVEEEPQNTLNVPVMNLQAPLRNPQLTCLIGRGPRSPTPIRFPRGGALKKTSCPPMEVFPSSLLRGSQPKRLPRLTKVQKETQSKIIRCLFDLESELEEEMVLISKRIEDSTTKTQELQKPGPRKGSIRGLINKVMGPRDKANDEAELEHWKYSEQVAKTLRSMVHCVQKQCRRINIGEDDLEHWQRVLWTIEEFFKTYIKQAGMVGQTIQKSKVPTELQSERKTSERRSCTGKLFQVSSNALPTWKYLFHRRSRRLAPITNLTPNARKLLQEPRVVFETEKVSEVQQDLVELEQKSGSKPTLWRRFLKSLSSKLRCCAK